MDDRRWWRITAKWEEIENLSTLLFEIGIQGLEIQEQYNFQCYLNCEENTLSNYLDRIASLGAVIKNTEMVNDCNWIAKCEELWEPVQIGKIRIVPVLDSDALPSAFKHTNDIFIVPGEGFGTGHHDSTRFAIELMQIVPAAHIQEGKILDMGCGSGILALAAHKIFKLKVDAVDNDPSALKNADLNIRLNSTDEVKTLLTPISGLEPDYCLIAANIYAEVLINMKSDFERILANSSYLILSGIMSNLLTEILDNYRAPTWNIVETRDSGKWSAVLLRKL